MVIARIPFPKAGWHYDAYFIQDRSSLEYYIIIAVIVDVRRKMPFLAKFKSTSFS